MNFFNFGEEFIKLVNIILTNIKLCVIQHGIFSKFFEIGRGCRQGDPASPYIFLLCVEIMGIMIRQNKDITGISHFGREYKLMQYADDTTLILDGTEKSLKSALTLVNQYAKFSGLRPNYDKTCCVKIGKLKNTDIAFKSNYNILWSQEPFSLLGITFSADLKGIIELNYEEKINAIRKLISTWNKRNISTIGRITVVKSLLLPKLVHLFMSLPNPNHKLLSELDTLFFNYVWNSKRDRVARKLITKDYKEGGLKMIELSNFIKSLKLTWIRRLSTSDSSWSHLLKDSLPSSYHFYHCFGIKYSEKIIPHLNPFWKDVFLALSEFRNIIDENIMSTSIWYSDYFKIDKKSIFIPEWFERGVTYIDDFFK